MRISAQSTENICCEYRDFERSHLHYHDQDGLYDRAFDKARRYGVSRKRGRPEQEPLDRFVHGSHAYILMT